MFKTITPLQQQLVLSIIWVFGDRNILVHGNERAHVLGETTTAVNNPGMYKSTQLSILSKDMIM